MTWDPTENNVFAIFAGTWVVQKPICCLVRMRLSIVSDFDHSALQGGQFAPGLWRWLLTTTPVCCSSLTKLQNLTKSKQQQRLAGFYSNASSLTISSFCVFRIRFFHGLKLSVVQVCLALTIPVTTCIAEQSFSTLHRLRERRERVGC